MNAPDCERLHTTAGSRALDRLAIVQQGISGFELMTRAGHAAFDRLLQRWPQATAVTVCCGKGNNAGDGYVLARLANASGLRVEVLQLGDPGLLSGDAALARDALLASGVPVVTTWPAAPAGDVVVDALVGTGLRGTLAPAWADAVTWINTAGRPVLALDLPTGVSADTGAVTEPAVRATETVMFIGRKLGLYTGPGVSHAGCRTLAGLGVSADVRRQVDGVALLRYPMLPAECRLPPRDPGSYKQSFGHVLVIGGDHAMGGAVLMTAEAALRSGAGLVTVVTRATHRSALLARRPELMVVDADDAFARLEALGRATCLVVGPGLGRTPWGEALLREALQSGKPAVLDADGLHAMAVLGSKPMGPIVATPHPGEAAVVLRTTSAAVQADRPAAACALAERIGGVAVLKGAGTLIACCREPGAEFPVVRSAPADSRGNTAAATVVGVCAHGNPGMASAGMGDVLAGIIGGLLAQGLEPTMAAVAGVCLHSHAADLAAERWGQRSLLATDLIEPLADLLAAEEASWHGARLGDLNREGAGDTP